MHFALRDYQTDCINAILDQWKAGISRQAIQLPTGSGKTCIMAGLSRAVRKKTLLIAHRRELITQARDKFRLFYPEASLGICMGPSNELNADVVIASIQTCIQPSRLTELQAQGFELILVDEAHHATAPSYRTVIDALLSEGGLLVGVSATLRREDGAALSDVFGEVTYQREIGEMIEAGHLSPVRGRQILTRCNVGKIDIARGDFVQTQLAEAVNTPERNAFIADKYLEHTVGKKAAAFCVDVQHCKDLAHAFNEVSVPAAAIYGAMPEDERTRALAMLKTGELKILTSCGVLLEGFDEPSLDAVFMCRPTKSRTVYVQAIGRALRTFPGKECCHVLDFTDEGHRLDEVVTLSATIPSARIELDSLPLLEPLEGLERGERTLFVSKECDQELELLGNPRLMWISLDDRYWSLIDDERNEIVMLGGDHECFTATVYFKDGGTKEIVKAPMPLEYCASLCETFARANLPLKFADLDASWVSEGETATRKQADLLLQEGVNPTAMTRREAALAIRRVFARSNRQQRLPCTVKQRWFLEQHGVDAGNLTKQQAQRAISELKRVG